MKQIVLGTLLFSQIVFADVVGFKLTEVKPGSIYTQLGLENGDVLKKINNHEVNSLNEVMKYLANPSTIKSVKVLRNGKEVDFDDFKFN